MISRKKAEHAQQVLGERLDYPHWLRGIGIMHDDRGSYFLKVNVKELTNEIYTTVPSGVEGVPIQLAMVETLQANDFYTCNVINALSNTSAIDPTIDTLVLIGEADEKQDVLDWIDGTLLKRCKKGTNIKVSFGRLKWNMGISLESFRQGMEPW